MKLQDLFEEKLDNIVALKIQKDIKKASMDPNIHINRAVELVNRVYHFNNVDIPHGVGDTGYQQYQEFCILSVKQLHKATAKGIRDDKWMFTPND